jgi:hypothetical protein
VEYNSRETIDRGDFHMITINSTIMCKREVSRAIQFAVEALKRDIENTCYRTRMPGIPIVLNYSTTVDSECYLISLQEKRKCLFISASDDLGFIYGIYHISKRFLGVNEFWFWNEQAFTKKEGYPVPDDYFYESKPFPVRFRGWFINDEVLLDSWQINGDKDKPWEMAFETLLRLGGNMTIPGTDENAHIYNRLASDMGLWITHHHAEPLGAKMFARAYPDLEASYDKHPDLFEELWEKAIDDQKDYKVIWNLGFRGQGDRPFWSDDPAYDTDKKRGALISKLIRKQYDMIKSRDENAICCSNLYGEIMELYKKGLLDIPEDVIYIWADNGFGKMVSRRQGNHNPRVPALPKKNASGRHGIYYHASFYDLQAAAQMTMLPNSPEFVAKELLNVYERKANDFWIINCSNIKPHTYYLDFISKLWSDENSIIKELQSSKDKDFIVGSLVEQFTNNFCIDYYDYDHAKEISELYKLWPKFSPSYGPNEDDHAGEQFANHGARVLASAFVTGFNRSVPMLTPAADEWLWFSNKKVLKAQIEEYKKVVETAVRGYEEYLKKCEEVAETLPEELKQRLGDLLIWQVKYQYYSFLGSLHICNAMEACFVDAEEGTGSSSKDKVIDCISQGQDKEGSPDYLKGFYEAGIAAKTFRTGYKEMRSYEKGVFEGFFENDCEADIRQSFYVAKGLMSYMRFNGDGPHFYKWQRMYQQEAGGNKVHLILRIKKHLTDEELWQKMYLESKKQEKMQ